MNATSVPRPASLDIVLPFSTPAMLRWDTHEHLFHEGDPASAIYEIKSGAVVIYRTTFDGCRLIQGVRFKGELVGVGYGGIYGLSAVAVRPTTACSLSRSALDRMIDADPAIARCMMQALTSELIRTSDQLMVISGRTAIGRVAACLIDLSSRAAGGADTFLLPLSRAEMGDLLGLTIETVSRSMSRLRSQGIIALPRSDTVTIRNRSELTALAEDDGAGAARGRLCA